MNADRRGPAYERLLDEERIILEITEALTGQMNNLGMNREEVAAAAGVHPDELRQELQGAARMNVRKLIRVAAVLEMEPRLAPRRRATRHAGARNHKRRDRA